MEEEEFKLIKGNTICGFKISRVEKINSPSRFLSILHIESEKALIFGWSIQKKDYWYDKDPSTATFFRMQKKVNEETIQRGIYVGRLAMVLMTPKGEDNIGNS